MIKEDNILSLHLEKIPNIVRKISKKGFSYERTTKYIFGTLIGSYLHKRIRENSGNKKVLEELIKTMGQSEITKDDIEKLSRKGIPIIDSENGIEVNEETIITRAMWEECQVQKKKNSRSYQRTLTYLFLQKLKCPKCGRILGGKATTKKNGNSYYYYYCNDCKITIKEKMIEEYFDNFIDELVEYDSVVNQFFLPMIKQKFDEPKEQIEKELKKQNDKLERIRKAYINEAFSLEEYNAEKKIVDDTITKLKEEFEEARLEYNSKQTRDDRKIDDYFKKISDNSKNDLACEIIIELGDKKYWDTKDENFKHKMSNVFKEQVNDLEELVPEFKIASAIIHYDETSPHLHIVGVPIKYKNKMVCPNKLVKAMFLQEIVFANFKIK